MLTSLRLILNTFKEEDMFCYLKLTQDFIIKLPFTHLLQHNIFCYCVIYYNISSVIVLSSQQYNFRCFVIYLSIINGLNCNQTKSFGGHNRNMSGYECYVNNGGQLSSCGVDLFGSFTRYLYRLEKVTRQS